MRTVTRAPRLARARTARCDEYGVWLPPGIDTAVEVVLEGLTVWSFNPDHEGAEVDGGRMLAWPRSLRPFLVGSADVIVREYQSGTVHVRQELRFSNAPARVSVRDSAGFAMRVDKMGRLTRSFEEPDAARLNLLLKAARMAIDLLTDDGGVPAFLAFGALLGAVRTGHLIAHDNDIDIAYLSAFTHPADVARESYQLERAFVAKGWRTWRFSANDFKVLAEGIDDDARWIDVFGAFVTDDTLYVMPTVSAPPNDVRILPLSTIELEGHVFPAPAEPESLLAATYGPDWRTPDPSFKFQVPEAVERRLDGWMRNAISNRGHWFPFYEGARSEIVPSSPSAFAEWVASQVHPGTLIVDIGCGTGRDSLWFAEQGFAVRGLDYAPPAVSRGRAAAAERGLDVRFDVLNLEDMRQVLAVGASLSHEDRPVAIYARFLLHALTERARHNLLFLARMCLRREGELYLEFRAAAARPKYEFGEHFRQLLPSNAVAAEIEKLGGRINYQEEGYGMAVYKDEDPLVGRMVATWQR